jgi:hypothetical protein
MLRRFSLFIASLATLLCLVPAVQAAAYDPFGSACQSNSGAGASSAACQADGSDPITGKNGILYKTSRILAFVSAVAAVIMIIIGGLMNVTAGGDANRAKTGRSMIVGALIGLAVIAVAEVIIALVINIVN